MTSCYYNPNDGMECLAVGPDLLGETLYRVGTSLVSPQALDTRPHATEITRRASALVGAVEALRASLRRSGERAEWAGERSAFEALEAAMAEQARVFRKLSRDTAEHAARSMRSNDAAALEDW